MLETNLFYFNLIRLSLGFGRYLRACSLDVNSVVYCKSAIMNVVSSVIFCLLIVVTNGYKISDQRSTPTELQRIHGGNDAARNQFKYQLSLYVHPSNAFCGASLITVKTALTAGHCIVNSTWVSVVFGSLFLDKYYPDEPYQIIQNATGILVHPNYLYFYIGVAYDVGLVFFNEVTPNAGIAVIALPADASSDYTNAEVVLTGYKSTVSLT